MDQQPGSRQRTRRSTADTRQDPRDLTATPKTARRIKSGATACAQPTCGPDPRTSAWRSADPRHSDAVLANLSPATSRPASTTGEHQELLTGGSHLTAPFHIRRSSASATASATSPTTAYGCCTAASPGRLTEPQHYEAAHHAWWPRAELRADFREATSRARRPVGARSRGPGGERRVTAPRQPRRRTARLQPGL